MIAADPRNADVLFPYMGGEDLNTRPDSSGSRWIVNFFDWPEHRARSYKDPWQWVETHVRPDRMLKDREKYPKMVDQWWRFWNERVELYDRVAQLERVILLAQVSKTVQPVMVEPHSVYSHKLIVFASDDPGLAAVLASNAHYHWALKYSATMRADLSYSPTDVWLTLPLPALTSRLRDVCGRLHTVRSGFMLGSERGLTKTYNLVHDPGCSDSLIATIRRLHVEIDEAVCEAYGWDDLILQLAHAHYETRQGVRWTIATATQIEILDRLLKLNHERYAHELAQGLHGKGKKGKPAPRRNGSAEGELSLFGNHE